MAIRTMCDCHRKWLLYVKPFVRISRIPWLRLLPSQPQAPTFATAARTSEKMDFRMNYLVDTCGFSPEIASKLSNRVSFLNSEKPDSVLKLLRSLDISDSELRIIIKKAPYLLSCDPVNTILPKLEFFRSKGASSSLIAYVVTCNPTSLHRSLENHIIPCYDLVRSFFHSDALFLTCVKRYPRIISDNNLAKNVNALLDNGVPVSSIALLLRNWPKVFGYKYEFETKIDEVKALGFHPSKVAFILAFRIKIILTPSTWKRKVELFEKWGWSYETLIMAFLKNPSCMLTSDSKVEAVMGFFINQMGWDSLMLANYPLLFQFSLEKRTIPRASVLQFLESRGLIKKIATCAPFIFSDEKFHQKYVNSFKDQAPQLLKLYEEKLNLSR